jgi:Divergent InlB B-repeat domain/Immunoglobulin domain
VVPVITSQPANQTAPVGGSATFNVTAVGTPPLSYQWRRNGIAVGQNSPTLNLTGITTTDSGTYTVRVSNAAGAAPSELVTLTVNTAYVLRIIDGIRLIEAPPIFIGDSPAAVRATIKNISGSTIFLSRIQVDGDFVDATGNLLNQVSWNAENFPTATPLAIAPGGTYEHVASHDQSPFPSQPAKVTARLKVKFNGIAGLKEVTDAEGNASAILAFETLDKYELTVGASANGTISKTPDFINYGAGTQMTLAASPNQGYVFVRWAQSGNPSFSSQNPVTVTITANIGLSAVFEPMTPRVNVSISGGIATLTWPDWGTAFLLEAADTTTMPLLWNIAGTTPAVLGNTYSTTLPVGAAPKVFRLRKP